MTVQADFDTILAHSRTMTEKSTDAEGEACKYRDDKGGKCFIGCLISDADYDSDWDGTFDAADLDTILGGRYNTEFYRGAQHIHDLFDLDRWEHRLEQLALKHGLKYDAPPSD